MTPEAALETALALELEVWEALRTGDRAADEALLAADFLGVYPSGFADGADHAGQLDDGPSVARFAIEAPRVQTIGDEAILLSYRARFARAATPEREEAMLVSSLWRRRGGRWINTFSQDTPVA